MSASLTATSRERSPSHSTILQPGLGPKSRQTCAISKGERTLLVISDFYSNFIEVARVTAITTRSIIDQRAESSNRKIWDPRHPRYRQRASFRPIGVLRLRTHTGVQARDIVADLCSGKWKGGEGPENGEAPI